MNDSNDPDFCDLRWMTSVTGYNDEILADHYQNAANRLVLSLLDDRRSNWDDGLFIPIAYLYRHALELMLKDVYRWCIKLNQWPISKKPLSKHNLQKLWDPIKPILKEIWEGTDEDFYGMERGINFMEFIDRNGVSFRYAKGMDGQNHAELFPESIRLSDLLNDMTETLLFLQGCSTALSEAAEWRD